MALNEKLLNKFEDLVMQYSGLKVAKRDLAKLSEAVQTRMRACRITDPLLYYQKAILTPEKKNSELLALTSLLTNRETYFFRDPEQFSEIKNYILPILMQNRSAQKELRCWSAGTSTGEEAYSLAMLLYTSIPKGWSWDFRILGTELRHDLVEIAKEGIYSGSSFRAMPPGFKENYFIQLDSERWQIKPEIKKSTFFEQGNLVTKSFPNGLTPLHELDLILCRNVFIYLDMEYVAQIVKKFAATLKKGGFLVTGHGELQMIALPATLKPISLSGSVVYQKLC